MLFNSYEFIFLFLPLVLFSSTFVSAIFSNKIVVSWMIFVSLVFYSCWRVEYLILIVTSIGFNYFASVYISGNVYSTNKKLRKYLLVFSITINLLILGYYKYSFFIVQNFNHIVSTNLHFEKFILPIGISFFTFQQIAYLVDVYQDKVRDVKFPDYFLFVIFFPQLIAGPIVHHSEMVHQYKKMDFCKFDYRNISIGITIFFIGLFKKVIIADSCGEYSDPIFNSALQETFITFNDAWTGAIFYSFQLYFDFSGYTDMAIGLAKMLNVNIPINFNSPYKATCIIEFWRRWHITLSRFLRDYLYIPMGGSRVSYPKHVLNLMVTMLIGGLWHGAGWNFIIWGGLHGVFLIINHIWRDQVTAKFKFDKVIIYPKISCLFTFVCVIVAWVIFRAETIGSALVIIEGMFGFGGFDVITFDNDLVNGLGFLCFLLIAVWCLPNTAEIFKYHFDASFINLSKESSKETLVKWNPNIINSLIFSLIAIISIFGLSKTTKFLYFNF